LGGNSRGSGPPRRHFGLGKDSSCRVGPICRRLGLFYPPQRLGDELFRWRWRQHARM